MMQWFYALCPMLDEVQKQYLPIKLKKQNDKMIIVKHFQYFFHLIFWLNYSLRNTLIFFFF